MTNIVFSPTLQAPIVLSNPTGGLSLASDQTGVAAQANPIPAQGAISLVGAAVRLSLSMTVNASAVSFGASAAGVVSGLVTPRNPLAGSLSLGGSAPTVAQSSVTNALTFPRVMLVGNGGDQSYGSNAGTGYPAWTTAAAGSAANIAVQTIGAYDAAILAGVFENWDTNGARDRENFVQALLKNAAYTVTRNVTRPTAAFFYHVMNEGDPGGSGTGYDQLIAQINAMNGWLYESAGGVGTKTPSAFAGNLINYSTAWPGGVGSALTGQSIVGSNYGSLSTGGPTGAQGVARTNGSYAADKLLIKGATGDTRWSFNAQMAAPSAAGVMLDNCFVALDGAGNVPNSSLDGLTLAPGSQQGGGYPALDTVQPLLARGIHNFFDQVQVMTATYGTPGKTYYNFGNLGQYGNKYQFGIAPLTCGLENTMHGGLLEDVMGAGVPSWEYQQTGKPGGGNYLSGWPNVLANYYQAMDFCLAPKMVCLAIRLPAADGSSSASWVNGGGSTLVSVTAGSALEYQEMRCGLCTTLLDDGYFGVGVSGYDWSKARWYDEFGDDSLTQVNVKRGYLGAALTTRPTVPTWAQGALGVWSRSFANGMVIVNPRGNGPQTVTLPRPMQKLRGTQQPTTNNGAVVMSVTLADGDGVILLNATGQLLAGHWVPARMPLTPTRVVLPRPDTETSSYAYNRHAHPGMQYVQYVRAQGGAYPHWYELISAPTGATIGQLVNGADYGVVRWTPTSGTQTFVVRIHDQDGVTTDVSWTVLVDATWFNFVDSTNGNDSTGDGTIANPWKTYAKAVAAVSGGEIVVLRAGTYQAPAAAVTLSSTKHSAIVNFPGESVTMDCSTSAANGGCWNETSNDLYAMGIAFSSGPANQQNPRYFTNQNPGNRLYKLNCSFDNPPAGTAGSGLWDNQACWFLGNGNGRQYAAMVGCSFSRLPPSGNGFMAIDVYNTQYLIVDECTFGTPNPSVGEQNCIFIKGGDNREISVRKNVWTVAWAPSIGQINFYCGSDGSGGQSTNQEMSYNTVLNTNTAATWNSFAAVVNQGQNNSFAHQAWSDRNTFLGIPVIWYGTANALNMTSFGDAIMHNATAAGAVGKWLSVNPGGSLNSFVNPASVPNITFSISGTECQGNTGAGIVDATGKLTGTFRTNYLGLRGAEIA